MDIKEIIKKEIKTALEEMGAGNMEIEMETPPDGKMGDLAFPCFGLSKISRRSPLGETAAGTKKSPNEIAEELAQILKPPSPPLKKGGTKKEIIEKIETQGGYVNFFYKRDVFLENVFREVAERGNDYGKPPLTPPCKGGENTPLAPLPAMSGTSKRGGRVMVEYSSPNTNKPLHLGHGRNNFLGMAISNLLENAGEKVIRGMIINDRGIHICKSMVAYQEYGNGETPEKLKMKGDHFVGKYYGMFGEKLKEDFSLEEKAKVMLRKWEAGDEEVMGLWEKMNKWYYEGVDETYEKIGSRFDSDAVYYESQTYKQGKEIVMEALDKKIVYKKKDGAIAIDLSGEGLDEKILLRSDETSVYITQDLYTAVKRFKEFGLEKLIYVVGNEQNYHFDVLFKILNKLGYEWAGNNSQLFHLSYGMVNLPEGKLKSREGTKVDLDDLVYNLKNLAMAAIREKHGNGEEIKKLRNKEIRGCEYRCKQVSDNAQGKPHPDPPLRGEGIDGAQGKFHPDSLLKGEGVIEERAMRIGLAALKFMLLRVNPNKDVFFNPMEAVSFEGDTGPYILYAYTRIKSILRKAGVEFIGENGENSTHGKIPPNPPLQKGEVKVSDEEMKMAKMIYEFPDVLEHAAVDYNPSLLANYMLELASVFNKFYHIHSVLDAETEELRRMRLELIQAVAIALERGMELLGIEMVEEM